MVANFDADQTASAFSSFHFSLAAIFLVTKVAQQAKFGQILFEQVLSIAVLRSKDQRTKVAPVDLVFSFLNFCSEKCKAMAQYSTSCRTQTQTELVVFTS